MNPNEYNATLLSVSHYNDQGTPASIVDATITETAGIPLSSIQKTLFLSDYGVTSVSVSRVDEKTNIVYLLYNLQ